MGSKRAAGGRRQAAGGGGGGGGGAKSGEIMKAGAGQAERCGA